MGAAAEGLSLGSKGFSVHLELEEGPKGTATLSLRRNDMCFVTARFPVPENVSVAERMTIASAAAKDWLLKAAAAI